LFSTVLMMRGSFFSISSFIERIEQLPLLVKVSDLSMKMISQENPGIQTELTLEFYQMKDGLL
ncbi:MAG: type 4a pilus biogenesis protein PilO, partial [Deltaproteobacteria bacterium]|nr:type 4a pilus biogenesis protein PilO [Deltaproteobacteria bacterium]